MSTSQVKFFRAYFAVDEAAKTYSPIAKHGEIVIPGTFLYSRLDPEKSSDKQKVQSLWLGIESFGFSRMAEISTISANDLQRMINRIAHYLVENKFVPDLGKGFEHAQEEAEHSMKLADRELGTIMLVDRKMEDFGVSENFKTLPKK